VAWPRGRSSHSLGKREESCDGVKEMRSRVQSREGEEMGFIRDSQKRG